MNQTHIKTSERIIVYGFFGLMDLLQIILDLFVVTEPVNNVLDFVIGGILLAYGQWRKLWTGQKLLVLLAVFVGEQIPFVNAAPFWTLDIKNLYSGVPQEPVNDRSADDYFNNSGIRRPQQITPLNSDGVRAPTGN